jgi:3-dehydroquinate dehydratase-1
MYCISLGTKDFEIARKEILKAEMAEIRLDLTHFNQDQIVELCKLGKPLIFTFRKSEFSDETTRIQALSNAIDQQAAWIDVDIDEDQSFITTISQKIAATGNTRLILSYHNYNQCPTNTALYDVIIRATGFSPDLIKIACLSHGIRDNKRILSFNKDFSNIMAFCMGEIGKSTRAFSLLMGAPFAYVALKGESTAPGQMTVEEMEDMMMEISQRHSQ